MNESITIHKFKNEYKLGVYNPPILTTIDEHSNVLPLDAHCKYVKPDINKNLMKYVIGKKGCRFNEITETSGVNYIWYKKEQHIIEIWGNPSKLDIAHKIINDEIEFIKFKIKLDIKNKYHKNIFFISNDNIII